MMIAQPKVTRNNQSIFESCPMEKLITIQQEVQFVNVIAGEIQLH